MTKILATDLDGTLIPLPENPTNRADLQTLTELLATHGVQLVFVTGRHLPLIEEVIEQEKLPVPDWIVADIGTSIYHRTDRGTYELLDAYSDHLAGIPFPIGELRERLASHSKLRIQEPEKQGRFKLSYYTDPADLPGLVKELGAMLRDEAIACTMIHSVDPPAENGLIDFLPDKASKAYALDWWHDHIGIPREEIVYAGDSGNDLAAFLAGYRTVVVRNAQPPIPRTVFDAHRRNGWRNRFFYSTQPATSGVLEGCRWFELFPMHVSPTEVSPTACDRLTEATPTTSNHTDHFYPPLGATPITCSTTSFRVWAPKHKTVHVHAETEHGPIRQRMIREEGDYHVAVVEGVEPGDRYGYELDARGVRPDPVSFYQPDGVHGRSMVVDHRIFPWQDDKWRGIAKRDLVIYELHVGTFTEAGTFARVIEQLDYLRGLGITAIELMPVAQSAGRWNWGYDGVNLYAPRDTYGTPDDLKALVDAAHAAGIAVLLDVVYNHLGPEGNYLAEFGPYFSEKHSTPWGPAFNFDDPYTGRPVRDYIIGNALYWLREYHLDGLRLDAIHLMHDDSRPPLTHELAETVARFKQETDRTIHLIAESNVYDEDFMAPDPTRKTSLFDACWCDDIMHAAYSVTAPGLQLTHRPYCGPNDLAEALQHGYIYANLHDEYTRVTPEDRRRLGTEDTRNYLASLVVGLQTHDVIGNHPHGKRIHHLTSKEAQKAIAALILLYPTIPILFMGEEHASDSLFPFFVDFTDPYVRDQVDQGRMREYPHHDWSSSPLPGQAETFHAAILKTKAHNDPIFEWYRALLDLRRLGIEAGWLTPENLTVETDPSRSLFILHYCEVETKRLRLSVAACLAESCEDLPLLEFPFARRLLLDSKLTDSNTSSIVSSVQLDTPHAVVLVS